MKKLLIMASLVSCTLAVAAPMRVAVLDFEDQTGMKPDALLGGTMPAGALAKKGVYLLGKQLVNQAEYTLVDRRDLIAQMEALQLKDDGRPTPVKPSFLHAAQLVRADVVLRGSLVSFSSSKRLVNQGGYKADFSDLTIRVALEALDAVDGSVVAIADGAATKSVRQTEALQTMTGEDDLLQLMSQAIDKAVDEVSEVLAQRAAKESSRETILLTITSNADPALVEIDGVLVGSTPLENLSVYKGDHVLTVGKAGHRDITKRILLEANTQIEVPLMRVELNAEEMKEVFESMRIHAVVGAEPALIIHTEE